MRAPAKQMERIHRGDDDDFGATEIDKKKVAANSGRKSGQNQLRVAFFPFVRLTLGRKHAQILHRKKIEN